MAICGVSQAFVVGRLRDTYALGCDAEACAVHQSHHVFNQAEFAVATKLCVCIFVDEFAGGRAVNSEFVLDTAHIHTALALVVDKHGKSAAVGRSFFRTCEDQMNICIAVGDESLDAIQQPAAVFLAVSGL